MWLFNHSFFTAPPGRYVGVEIQEEDDEVFEEKMKRLVAEPEAQFAKGAKLEEAIKRNLRELGFYGKLKFKSLKNSCFPIIMLKERIRRSQIKAALAANQELIRFIGTLEKKLCG